MPVPLDMPAPLDDHSRALANDGEHDVLDPAHDPDPGPPPVQFRLKTLLGVTTLAAVLCAVLSRVSDVWAAAVVWISILVAGHVVANAMGTRASARVSGRPLRRAPVGQLPPVDPKAAAAPTTTLGRNATLGFRLFVLVGIGGVVGSLIGTTLVWVHNDRRLAGSALVLAAFSSAVVGAFLTFLTASCFHVSAKAVRAARDHAAKE